MHGQNFSIVRTSCTFFVVIRTSYSEVCRADRGKWHLLDSSWAAKLFARQTELSWTDVRETSVNSRHFFSRKRKPQSKFCSPIFFSFFLPWFFPSSFWRRVTRLAPTCSYWTILVKQILNQWMNLKKSVVILFRPNQIGDSAKTVKPQRKPSIIQIFLTNK